MVISGNNLVVNGTTIEQADLINISTTTSDVQTQLGQMIGVGQTWQDVTASRSAGVTYTNTTGKPIFVSIFGNNDLGITINGIIQSVTALSNDFWQISVLVPNGSTYSCSSIISNWFELR